MAKLVQIKLVQKSALSSQQMYQDPAPDLLWINPDHIVSATFVRSTGSEKIYRLRFTQASGLEQLETYADPQSI